MKAVPDIQLHLDKLQEPITRADATVLGRSVENAVQQVASEAVSQYELLYDDMFCSKLMPTAYEVHNKILRRRRYINIFADADFSSDHKLSFGEFMELALDLLKSYILGPPKVPLYGGARTVLMNYRRKISGIAWKSQREMISKVDFFGRKVSPAEIPHSANTAFSESKEVTDAEKSDLASPSGAIKNNPTELDTLRSASAVHDSHKDEASKCKNHSEQSRGTTTGNFKTLDRFKRKVTFSNTVNICTPTDDGIEGAHINSSEQSRHTTGGTQQRTPR